MRNTLNRAAAWLLCMLLIWAGIPTIAEGIPTMTLPESLLAIEEQAFYQATSIEKVIVPPGTQEIGSLAFAGSSLKEIALPSTLTYIAPDAFLNCGEIAVDVPEDCYAYRRCVELGVIAPPAISIQLSCDVTEAAVGDTATWAVEAIGGVTPIEYLFELWKDGSVIATRDYSGESGYSYTFTDAGSCWVVAKARDAAGQICEQIGGSVYVKQRNATDPQLFTYSNQNQTYCQITGYIGEDTDIVLPEKSPDGHVVQRIGAEAFSGAELTSVYIPGTVESIGTEAFGWCEKLVSVHIPDSVTRIDPRAFNGCESLTSVDIPDSVRELGSGAFEACESLTRVRLSNSLTVLEPHVFCGCTSLTSISIPNSVVRIRTEALALCDNLKSVRLPASLETIDERVFSDCFSLTNVEIPSAVTAIGEGAFGGCAGLISLRLPDSLQEIAPRLFDCCTGLLSLYVGPNVASVGEDAFRDVNPDLVIYCQKDSFIAQYAASQGIKYSYEEFLGYTGGSCGENLFWRLSENGLLTIYGSGDMTDFVEGVGPWFDHRDRIFALEIDEGVTGIGEYAFAGCARLARVSIPGNVKRIGRYAFANCSRLTDVEFKNAPGKIDEGTFANCRSLSAIVLPDSVNVIGHKAFSGCASLADITIPLSVGNIESAAFENCGGLTDARYPGPRSSWEKVVIAAGNDALSRAAFHCVEYRALLIGNTYEGTEDELSHTLRDRNAIQTMLSAMKDYGNSITPLPNLTADEIVDAITSTFADADEDDVSLFSFAGHGARSGALAGEQVNGERTYLSPNDLLSALETIPGKKIVLLASCYSGVFIDVVAASANSSDYNIITASSNNEKSYYNIYRNYGAFAFGLAAANGYDMGKEAYIGEIYADVNGDRAVTLKEAYDGVYLWVYEHTHGMGAEIKPHTPQAFGDPDFVLWRY